ncbi:hypothetical protein KSZ_61150 [Dictyobacter formicarum]|uniref:Uncharacterized protein n=1 Tax=Dictyobacter formicarum TaxID=2778368 RepID=A0ABQ3VPD2_9CHLR|nr:hypothetical protein KSZ_61150 [Dictyobacter formicarum]
MDVTLAAWVEDAYSAPLAISMLISATRVKHKDVLCLFENTEKRIEILTFHISLYC